MTHSALPAAAIIAAALFTAIGGSAHAAGLDVYRWKARPVIVFAPRHGDRQVIDQLGRLKDAASALADRAMPVLLVNRRDVAEFDGAQPDELDGAELRRIYGVADDAFAIVLIGKDGGEKLKSDKPVDASRLTGLVDSMPMRQDETQATGSVK